MWEDDLKIVEFAPPEGGKKIGDGARTQEIFLDFIMTHAHFQSNASSYLFNDNFNGMKSPGEKELQEKLLEVGVVCLGLALGISWAFYFYIFIFLYVSF